MKIRALLENTGADPALTAERGLSLFVETKRHKILFDAGQTDAFAENALRIGVDLREVDVAVLSHGHYDHGGGPRKFLALNDRAPVYLSKFAFEPHLRHPRPKRRHVRRCLFRHLRRVASSAYIQQAFGVFTCI